MTIEKCGFYLCLAGAYQHFLSCVLLTCECKLFMFARLYRQIKNDKIDFFLSRNITSIACLLVLLNCNFGA